MLRDLFSLHQPYSPRSSSPRSQRSEDCCLQIILGIETIVCIHLWSVIFVKEIGKGAGEEWETKWGLVLLVNLSSRHISGQRYCRRNQSNFDCSYVAKDAQPTLRRLFMCVSNHAFYYPGNEACLRNLST